VFVEGVKNQWITGMFVPEVRFEDLSAFGLATGI
jgi:hypothetical protein